MPGVDPSRQHSWPSGQPTENSPNTQPLLDASRSRAPGGFLNDLFLRSRQLSCSLSKMSNSIGVVGRHVPAYSSTLRPDPLVELSHWGGARIAPGKRVLDLGCGDGRFALGLAPLALRVDGLDPDPDAIKAAKKNAGKSGIGNVHFRVGAAQELPYPDASFDVVLLSWTL